MGMANVTQSKVIKTSSKLLVLVFEMFAFAMWVMPPLYDALCEVLGINGKTGGRYEVVESNIDKERTVKVQFVAQNNEQMPWEFGPKEKKLKKKREGKKKKKKKKKKKS